MKHAISLGVVSTIFFILLAIFFAQWVLKEDNKNFIKRSKWETGPCGSKLVSDSFDQYAFGEKFKGNINDYFDDGEKVWVKKMQSPKNNGDEVKYFSYVIMERNPKACAEWIKKTGIDLRNK